MEEFRFDSIRKFRFDWAINSLLIAVEYEGLTDHATKKGMLRDVEKYNLAQSQGWVIIRMNCQNYETVISQVEMIIKCK